MHGSWSLKNGSTTYTVSAVRALVEVRYEVVGVVADIEQAMELAEMALPDLVLMDIGLGGRMGTE